MNPHTGPTNQDADSDQQCINSASPGITFAGPGSVHPAAKPTSAAEQQNEQHTVNFHTPNIIIFGETGVGKSSIINLVSGQKLAHTSNDALGCTFHHQKYVAPLDGMSCALWDTTGLDEGTEGTVPAKLAENNLTALMGELARSGGIHLVIYCIRGSRLTKALKRNYDLFYVTVCRKKVPVMLVVTGLEHQEGDMETWWAANETVLQRYGMEFDAHACVTTLDIKDPIIQQRRSDSQRVLRELVARYSRLPAWKIDSSFTSRVLPMFRTVLRMTMAAGRTKKSATTVRRVITCDMASSSDVSTLVPTQLLTDMTTLWKKTRVEGVQIDGQQYEFVHVDKCALQVHVARNAQHAWAMGTGLRAGVLVFYTSPLGDSVIPPEEVDMLEVFYEIAGGETCPVIVVLRDCDDEERATRECQNALSSRHKNIQVHPTTVSNHALTEMIGRLCIEHVEVKIPRVRRVYVATRQWFVTAVDIVISKDNVPRRRGRGNVQVAPDPDPQV